MKLLIKKNGFKVSAVLILLALSQTVLAAGAEQTTSVPFLSSGQLIGCFIILVLLVISFTLNKSHTTAK